MLRSLASFAIATALCPTVATAQEKADLLITNGHVYAGRAEGTDTAIAIRGRHIVAVGTDAALAKLRGSATRVLDAAGGWILPGLEDDHVHILQGAHALTQPDVRDAPDLAGVQQIVLEASRQNTSGWVQAGGWIVDLLPGKAPTRQMLDAVVPDRPVVLWSLDRHGAWANSKALALAGITRASIDPPMGEIVRDASGEPTGWLKEASAVALISKAIPEPTVEEHRRLLRLAMAEANRNGITAITHAALGGGIDEFNLLSSMDSAGQLTTRINYALGVDPGFTQAQFDQYQALWRANRNTQNLKLGAVKFFMDGVPQAHTAFLLKPWGPQPGTGHPLMPADEFRRWAGAFDAAGWQLMMHAMGDGAVRMALDEVAALNATKAPARGRRHRVEHAFLIDPADMPRFAKLGVIANFQPLNRFPPRTASSVQRSPSDGARWAGIVAAGGRISFGSDWPVYPFDPFGRIYAIASGRSDQRMDPLAVIEGYTAGTAYATFNDDRLGTLAPGKLADIVVLKSYLGRRIPTNRDEVRVSATVFDGTIVYQDLAVIVR